MTGSILQTGDQNIAAVQFQPATLPAPETVNIQAELAALKDFLAELASPDQRKIGNALDDAGAELTKPEPDKDEVGHALDRALTYAQKAEGFASAMDKLRFYVEKVAVWLGQNWYKLLAMLRLKIWVIKAAN